MAQIEALSVPQKVEKICLTDEKILDLERLVGVLS